MPLSGFWRCAVAVVIGSILGAGLRVASPAAAATAERPPPKAVLDQQIADASKQLEIVVEQYDAVREDLRATRAREAAVNVLLVPMSQAVRQAQANIGTIAANLYEVTTLSTFARLLNTSSTSTAGYELSTMDQLARARRQQIDVLYTTAGRYAIQQKALAVLDATQTYQRGVLHTKRAAIITQIARLTSMRLAAYGVASPPAQAPVSGYVPVYSPDAAGRAVKFAYDQIGKPYQWAADGPGSYDCSGLVLAAWRVAGVALPHNAAMQWTAVAHVTRAKLQPGDLVFYYTPIHHVAIYIGADKVIQAPEFGHPVGIAGISLAPIHGYGRPA